MRYLAMMLAFFTCTLVLSAQGTEDRARTGGLISEGDKIVYPVKLKFPQEVYNIYKMTETVKVKREYDDGNVYEYDKIYSYYFTLFMPGAPVDGFQKVKVSVDSLYYRFNSGGKTIEYANSDEAIAPLNFRDFLHHFLPVSTEFEVTYNGYGEISKTGGTTLEAKRKEWGGTADSVKRDFILRRISDNDLLFITDMAKGLLPDLPVAKDSSWPTKLYFEVDGLPYSGETISTLTDVQKGSYHISTQCDSLTIPVGSVFLNDLKLDASVQESRMKGRFDQVVNSSGSIQYAEGNFETSFRGKVNNVKFVQNSVSRFQWDLLERYRY